MIIKPILKLFKFGQQRIGTGQRVANLYTGIKSSLKRKEAGRFLVFNISHSLKELLKLLSQRLMENIKHI